MNGTAAADPNAVGGGATRKGPAFAPVPGLPIMQLPACRQMPLPPPLVPAITPSLSTVPPPAGPQTGARSAIGGTPRFVPFPSLRMPNGFDGGGRLAGTAARAGAAAVAARAAWGGSIEPNRAGDTGLVAGTASAGKNFGADAVSSASGDGMFRRARLLRGAAARSIAAISHRSRHAASRRQRRRHREFTKPWPASLPPDMLGRHADLVRRRKNPWGWPPSRPCNRTDV